MEATIRSFRGQLRLIPTRDSLDQINKVKLAKELESDLHIDEDPKDMAILKNVYGVNLEPEKLYEIYEEIIDPPYEKMNPFYYEMNPT